MATSHKHLTWYMVLLVSVLLAGFSTAQAADGDEFDLLITGPGGPGLKAPSAQTPPALAAPSDDDATDELADKPSKKRRKNSKTRQQSMRSGRKASQGRDAGPGGRGGRGGRGGMGQWGPPVDAEALMSFLTIHEPTLATKLNDLKQDDPIQFKRRSRMIGKLYSPVIEQMDRDPDMAALSLRQIRQNLTVRSAAETLKETSSDTVAQAELRESLSALFDTVIQQEQLRTEHFSQRLNDPEASLSRRGDKDRPARSGTDAGKGKGKVRGKGYSDADGQRSGRRAHRRVRAGDNAEHREKMLRDRLELHTQQIANWKADKDQILQQRYDAILDGQRPFPWGRQ
jgi:hypothetical protein